MISDRDPKFMSDFFQSLMQRLQCKMLTFTAYHEKIDGQSERTNQTVDFDNALTVRSYIQRRGRAGNVASKVVIMRSNEDQEALHLVYACEWSPTRRYNFSSNPC